MSICPERFAGDPPSGLPQKPEFWCPHCDTDLGCGDTPKVDGSHKHMDDVRQEYGPEDMLLGIYNCVQGGAIYSTQDARDAAEKVVSANPGEYAVDE